MKILIYQILYMRFPMERKNVYLSNHLGILMKFCMVRKLAWNTRMVSLKAEFVLYSNESTCMPIGILTKSRIYFSIKILKFILL